MSIKNNNYKAQVEARVKAEKETRKKTGVTSEYKIEISDEELQGYLNENRVGDAKLYTRLMRGKVVFVKHWERFLLWNGHHWEEDDYDFTSRSIERVCELYLGLADRLQKKRMKKLKRIQKHPL